MGEVATPGFRAEGRWEIAGRVAGGRGCRERVVKYYYILSCPGMFERGDFEEK